MSTSYQAWKREQEEQKKAENAAKKRRKEAYEAYQYFKEQNSPQTDLEKLESSESRQAAYEEYQKFKKKQAEPASSEIYHTKNDPETYRQFLKYQEDAQKNEKHWGNIEVPDYQERLINTGINPMHSQSAAGLGKPVNLRTDEEKIIKDAEEKKQWQEQRRAERDKENESILAKASEYSKAPDFAEKSKYTKSGRWIQDIDYEYVNHPEMAKTALTGNGGVTPQSRKGYDFVTEDERAIYNYIYSTEGGKSAKEYLEALNLEERMAEDTITWNKEYAKEKPVQASVTSVLSNLANAGQGFVESTWGNVTGYGIDINSYGNVQRRASNAIRETVAEDIENPVGKFFYQTGMSMADSITSQVAAAGLAMIGLPPAVGASAILASNAATDGIISAKERGVSDDQALMTGIVQGGAEWFFEKVSLGNLEALKETAPATFKELVKGVLKQGGIEGSEEVFTSIANAITDQIINKDLSELNLMKQYYISQGMSEEESEKQVKKDFAKQIGMDFLGGFASGTTMSTAVSTFNYALNKMDEKASEKAGTLPEETEKLPKESEMIPEETEKLPKESEMIPEEIEMEETEQIPWEEAQMYAGEPIGNTSEKGVAPAQKIEENQGILKGTEPKSDGEKIIDTVLENGNVSDNFADEIVKNDNLRKAFEAKTGITIRGNETEQRNTVKAVARSYAESHTGTVEQKKTVQNASVAAPARQNATIKGKGVEIVGVETENGSELKFKDSSGNSYTTSEVKFADGVSQKLYGAAAEIAMVSDSETANSFVKHYEASMPIQYYAIGFDRFYSLGKMGVPKATALKSLDFLVSNTSEEAMMNAWNLGNRSRENDRAKVEVKKEKQKRKGTGTYEDQTRNFNANAQLQTLVANRTGIDIKREAGTDENTNGYFIPSMMQMVISDKATNEYATLLHELGEFGLAYNKLDMKELQNMLLRYQAEQSGIKGVGETAALIKAYQRLYAEKEGSKTYEQAVDEMVNDALAGLFSSDEGVDQFVEWLQKDSGYTKAEQKSLVQQLMDLLDHIVKYLKTLVKEGRQSAAALKAAELEAARVEELRTKFLEVLEGAIETAHTTGEYETEGNVKFSLKNKHITPSTNIPFVVNGSYLQVAPNDFAALGTLQKNVRNIKRGNFENKATGYKADINSTTIQKILKPTQSFNPWNAKYNYIENLNASLYLPELFENAVYIDSKPPQKAKNAGKQIKEYHYFVAPLEMNNGDYKVIITAREKVNSNILYVVKAEILPNNKRGASVGGQKPTNMIGAPRTITVTDLMSGVNIYDYNLQQNQTYTDKDIKYYVEEEDSEGNRLSEAQQEFYGEVSPLLRDEKGRLRVLYHQTDSSFTEFDTKHEGAGSYDHETPYGIFLKPTSRDIGVKGKTQMPLYALIKNPLQVKDRHELVRVASEDSTYKKLYSKQKDIDVEYKKKYEDAKKAFDDYLSKWRKDNPEASRTAIYDDEGFQEAYDREDAVVEEWEMKSNEVCVEAKERLTEYLKEEGYDGLVIEKDEGSFGRATKTIIAFEPNQVKSITNQNPTTSSDIRHSFAGVDAVTANKSMLELANDMEQRGEDSETIRKHTGWHRGYDGKWRFEIDDSQMEIADNISNYMKLDQLVKHDKLFEAYPILKEVDVVFQNIEGNGSFDRQFFGINLNSKLKNDPEQLKTTLIHEIQHAIQHEEGFANGSNSKYWESRLENGYDSRPKEVQRRAWKLRKQYLDLKEAEPEFVSEMEKLHEMVPNIPRGAINWDTLEPLEEDPVEWQIYDAERERLEEKYGEEQVFDFIDLGHQMKRAETEGRRTGRELYLDTAGEIEARETSRRLTFDEASRRRYQPRNKLENLNRDNVVFADKIGSAREEVYAAHVDQNVLKKAEEFKRDGYKNFERVKITDVTERIKTDVEKLAGVDATGYQVYATTDTFKHIEKRHGENGKHDQTMKDMRDVALMGYVLNNYDSVELVYNENGIPETTSAYSDKNGKPSKLIKFGKEIDGIQYVVVATSENKYKKLWVLSEYRTQKKDTSQSSHDNTAPPPTPEANSDNVSFDDIISKDSENASEEFKHSISTEEYEELQHKHENTLRENDIFRHMIDYLTRSIEATKGTAISEKSAEGVANRMIRRYKSEADKGKLAAEVQKLFKMMSEGKANKEDFLYFAEETIRPVVEQSKNNKQISDYAKGILSDIIKTPIKLGKLAKQEAAYHYGSYNDFRRKLFGRAQISNNGTDLDILWQQWSGIYPELFDAETVAEDQPVRLAEIIDALKEDYDSEVGYNLEEAVTYAAMELMEEYAKLPEVKALTAAQDMAQMQRNIRKLNEEYRQQYEQKLRELKGEHKEKLARQEAKFRARMSQSRGSRLETQERKKYKDSIVKNTKEIMRWLEVNNDKYHVPEVLRETTIGFLGGMDFMSENGWNSQDTVMLQNRLNILYRKLSAESTKAEGDDVMADLDPDFLPTLDGLISLLEQSDEIKKIGDMDSLQLRDVSYLVGTLKRVITTANRLIANKQYQHVSQIGDSTVSFLARLKAKKQRGKWATMGDELLNLHMLDSRSFFEQMGEAAGSLWQELRDGFNQRTWKLERAKKYMEEVVGESKIAKWTGKKAETHSFEFNGQQFDITTGQLMTLYLLSKRPQAYNHLMAGATMYSETGGFTIDAQSVVKGQKIPERRIKVTDAQMKEMFKTLTPEQIRIAKAMQKFLAKDCAEWGNEVSMTMYGYKKFGEATYWPIKTNDNFNKTDDKNAETGAANTSLYAIRNQGMTKNLVKNASNPIVVGDVFEVFAEHVANMANYNAFVIPLSDAMKWFNYRSRSEEGAVTGSIKEEMERSYGKGAKRYFINFIKDINGEVKKGVASEISSTFTSKYKAAAVGANLRVVIQQPTAIFRAMSVMNPRYLAQGLVHGSAMKEMHENSAVSVWKSWGYFETGLGQSMKQVITGEGTVFERIVEGSMAGAGLADDLTWGVLWNAVKAEVQDKNKDIDTSSEEYIELVRKRFDEVIDQTQVVDTVLHRSQMMRSGDGVVKMASAFMAEPTKSYNLLHNAIRELNQNNNEENRRKVARRAVVYGFTAIATAALASVVDAFRDDEEEKDWAQKWIENWKANAIESINPISQIPYLKELSSLWQGFDSSRMDMAGVSTLVNAVQQAYKYINGESKKTLYGVTKGIIRGMSQVTGIPLYNALRDVESTIEQFTFAPFDEEQITGKDVRIRLIRAMREGNEKQVQKYLSWYDEQYKQKLADGKTDKEAKSSLKSSITSQWKSIYQNSTTAEKIEIKKMLLKIRVNGQQLYKDYDWSSWEEKKK